MRVFDHIREGARYLKRRWVRTALNLVGIGVGALAISLVTALGAGLRAFIRDQVRTLADPKVVQVFPSREPPMLFAASSILGRLGRPPRRIDPKHGMNPGGFSLRFLKEDELEALRALPYVVGISPGMLVFVDSLRLAGSKDEYEVVCIPEGEGFRLELAAGRAPRPGSDDEVVLAWRYLDAFGLDRPEKLIGREVVLRAHRMPILTRPGLGQIMRKMFGGSDSTEMRARVVGLARPSLLSVVCFIPEKLGVRIARFILDDPGLHGPGRFGLMANVHLRRAEDSRRLEKWLKERGMSMVSMEDRVGFLLGVFSVVEIGLLVFGLVALLVAGIGVASTIVANVYERRHEIGIMKALGARPRTVLTLFSMEALAVGVLGGVLGFAASYLLSMGADMLLNATLAKSWGGISFFKFRIWLGPATVLFCAACSFLAGLYPAWRASRLDPIVCLREE